MNQKLKILVVDDDKRMTHTLVDILNMAGHQVIAADSALLALEKVRREPFDCVLTDVRMPDMDGVAFHQMLRKEQPGLPVVLMTAYAADELIHQGLKEGIVGILDKPLNISQLLNFFSILAKNRTIAIVDDDPVFCSTLGDILRTRGFTVSTETDPHADMSLLAGDAQVLLLDLKLNSVSGLDTLTEIRKKHPDLPVLLVTAYRTEMLETIKLALENSAFTCMYKPLEITEILDTLTKIQLTRLRTAITDSQENTSLE